MAMWDLAAKSNYYYQMDAQKDTEKRRLDPRPKQQQDQQKQQDSQQQQQQQSEHQLFCDQMGILFPHGLDAAYTVRKLSYLYDRKRDFRRHTQQYWLVATLTTAFFLLQVIIGAVQTALGATHSPHILVTVFGAIATVIGGILAYLKSRGQPNRARQLRNSLRKVVEEIEFQEVQLRNPEIKITAKESVDYINQLYEDARFQAETNYPDFWSTAGTKATKPGSGATGPAAIANAHPPARSNSNIAAPRTSTQSQGTRPPPYGNPHSQAASASQRPSDQQYDGPVPPNPAAHLLREGGRPLQPPNRAAHIPSLGGRYMNEKV